MRAPHALVLACILTLSAAAANAQMPQQASLTADVKVDGTTLLEPGQSSGVTIAATRSCTSAGQILPAGTIRVNVVATSGIVTVTGATSADLPQLMCAQQQSQRIEVRLQATARSDVAQATPNFTKLDETLVFQVHADASDNLNQAPDDAIVSTLFVVQAPEEVGAAAGDAQAKASPGAGIELAVGLLGLVAAMRRRLA